jgi:hypothetical protein
MRHVSASLPLPLSFSVFVSAETDLAALASCDPDARSGIAVRTRLKDVDLIVRNSTLEDEDLPQLPNEISY